MSLRIEIDLNIEINTRVLSVLGSDHESEHWNADGALHV